MSQTPWGSPCCCRGCCQQQQQQVLQGLALHQRHLLLGLLHQRCLYPQQRLLLLGCQGHLLQSALLEAVQLWQLV
jgi:hypothetical protein